jgi:hypothetical protein
LAAFPRLRTLPRGLLAPEDEAGELVGTLPIAGAFIPKRCAAALACGAIDHGIDILNEDCVYGPQSGKQVCPGLAAQKRTVLAAISHYHRELRSLSRMTRHRAHCVERHRVKYSCNHHPLFAWFDNPFR